MAVLQRVASRGEEITTVSSLLSRIEYNRLMKQRDVWFGGNIVGAGVYNLGAYTASAELEQSSL